jgi:hypothetical protein
MRWLSGHEEHHGLAGGAVSLLLQGMDLLETGKIIRLKMFGGFLLRLTSKITVCFASEWWIFLTDMCSHAV